MTGLGAPPALHVTPGPDWPPMSIGTRLGEMAEVGVSVDADRARVRLPEAHLAVDRAAASAVVVASRPLDAAELVHPYLSPACALLARWQGRETLHAGAFVAGDGAWGVVGHSGDGKSTMLARLALAGLDVLCDDLLVLEDDVCFTGPRCVDLRAESAARLGASDGPLVRAASRRRLALEPLGGEHRLRGWIFLEWSERVGMVRAGYAERVRRLGQFRRFSQLGVDPVRWMEVARHPAFVLHRPREWKALDEVVERTVEAVGR